ncbi:Cupin domain protein [Trichophyton verrucosum HKI 0517]|uniref:Cupin domain protein n=1 Tax=Trichophyton verrucosum (strain HKI 0517) TaxID=663202 RepID=D4DDR3_TRIVH|nr:Cupin domain protein [Trichophyton verrucosum HKI 0517]EFE40008.1 Cupin domain protein [Trichophyton verrucosum HKI 0517]
MEELEGMFSSPEKSPVRTNGFANDGLMISEEMETGGNPSDVLSARRGGRNAYIPPPRSRSPMKSLMSGSPRRTPGLRSSPLPQSEFSSPTSTHVAAKRTINLTHPLPQASKSPLKQARNQSHPDSEEEEEAEQNKDEDEKEEEEEEEEEDKDEEASAGEHAGEEEGTEQEESEVEDGGSEAVPGDAADFSDDANYLIEDEAEDNGFVEGPGDYHEAADHRDVDAESSEAEQEQAGKSPVPVLNTASKGKKRKESDKNVEEKGDDEPKANHTGKGRGRKPKNRQEDRDQEPNNEDENPRPAKKAKKTAKSSNLQMTVDQEKELQSVVENITKNDGPLNKKRSLYILRRETPSDDTVRHTRSGRISVRPLAYWRNEKCVYGTGEAEVGQRFPLSTIKEIIRTEDPAIDQSGRKRGSKKKSKSKKKGGSESDDEPDENAEPWETQEGVFYGPVKTWDPEKQTGTQEEEMMGKIYYLFFMLFWQKLTHFRLDVAYAPSAIETHEVKDSTFRFAKILSTPFLGSGFVEMPPNAIKKQKNSKRMHMVFFVYYGRIRVDIAGLQFSAGKGCVFQVPRGELIFKPVFANEYKKPAAIFFTQGCIPLDADGNVDTGVAAPPVPEAPSTRTNNNATEKGGKKRGRPKQGAKGG